ncbi:hypothetical protein TNCV_1953861 [Trichonephila clavipes]|nr:hypothetical protein TNCV_1953861 [Trichonephila clavipes]
MPAGWCSWFVVSLVCLRLRVRPWPKSVDCLKAEDRQDSMSHDYAVCKRSLERLFCIGKNSEVRFRIVRA